MNAVVTRLDVRMALFGCEVATHLPLLSLHSYYVTLTRILRNPHVPFSWTFVWFRRVIVSASMSTRLSTSTKPGIVSSREVYESRRGGKVCVH